MRTTQTTQIRKGDKVSIVPERRDKGEEAIVLIAVEDQYAGWDGSQRVMVEAQLGWTVNPQRLELVSDLVKE